MTTIYTSGLNGSALSAISLSSAISSRSGIDIFKDKDAEGNRDVMFPVIFSNVPAVMCTVLDLAGAVKSFASVVVRAVSSSGFTYTVLDSGGTVSAEDWRIQWLAVDAASLENNANVAYSGTADCVADPTSVTFSTPLLTIPTIVASVLDSSIPANALGSIASLVVSDVTVDGFKFVVRNSLEALTTGGYQISWAAII